MKNTTRERKGRQKRMNDFEVLAALVGAFGDCLRTSTRYYQFRLGLGATIYVSRRFPSGFEPLARFRETALENFPNGRELDSFLIGNDLPREWRFHFYEYLVDAENIKEVVGILLDGLDLEDDWVSE